MARGTALVSALLLVALLATAPFDVLGTRRGQSSSVSERGTPSCGGIAGCEVCSGSSGSGSAARSGGGIVGGLRASNSKSGATCSACDSSYTQSFVLNGTTCGEREGRELRHFSSPYACEIAPAWTPERALA